MYSYDAQLFGHLVYHNNKHFRAIFQAYLGPEINYIMRVGDFVGQFTTYCFPPFVPVLWMLFFSCDFSPLPSKSSVVCSILLPS